MNLSNTTVYFHVLLYFTSKTWLHNLVLSISSLLRFRKEDGLDVLFITDITKNGERATEHFWEFSLLETQMEKGKLILLRFNLLDVQVQLNLKLHIDLILFF